MKKEKKPFRFPIRIKTILVIVTFGLFLTEIAMVFFSVVSSNDNQTIYKNDATDLSNTIALSIDKTKTKTLTDAVLAIYNSYDEKPVREEYEGTPIYEEYLAKFDAIKETEEYKYLQEYLAGVKSVNLNTEGIYLGWVDVALKYTVYIVYDQEYELFPVGVIDYLYEEDYPMIDNPKLGFVASIYDAGEEGMLVTAGAPIVDDSDNIICYALVDIALATVRATQASRITRLFFYLLSTVIVLCFIGIIVINFILIKPIKTLQDVTNSYDINDIEETHKRFTDLKLSVHDEFTDLAENMKRMENDIHNKINELSEVNKELVKSQKVAEKMTELANKDSLTGVRNKTAYDNLVKDINAKITNKEKLKFGVAMVDLNYLKEINDDYGHDSGDIALIKLCNLICATFAHSPVFRVGGDEFVIIVRSKDYTESDKLISTFNAKIDELSEDDELLPEEKISAAIGYSEFNKAIDNNVDDVFKRADKAMYERKHQMKNK